MEKPEFSYQINSAEAIRRTFSGRILQLLAVLTIISPACKDGKITDIQENLRHLNELCANKKSSGHCSGDKPKFAIEFAIENGLIVFDPKKDNFVYKENGEIVANNKSDEETELKEIKKVENKDENKPGTTGGNINTVSPKELQEQKDAEEIKKGFNPEVVPNGGLTGDNRLDEALQLHGRLQSLNYQLAVYVGQSETATREYKNVEELIDLMQRNGFSLGSKIDKYDEKIRAIDKTLNEGLFKTGSLHDIQLRTEKRQLEADKNHFESYEKERAKLQWHRDRLVRGFLEDNEVLGEAKKIKYNKYKNTTRALDMSASVIIGRVNFPAITGKTEPMVLDSSETRAGVFQKMKLNLDDIKEALNR